MDVTNSHRAEHIRLLVLADSAFPTGAFAHSWGLEWVVRCGWVTGAADLYPWVRDALRFGVAPMEARAVAQGALLAADGVTGGRADAARVTARVTRLSHDLATFLPSREARNASGQLGRSLLTAASSAFPTLRRLASHEETARASRRDRQHLQFPVAWGFVGGLLEIGTRALVEAFLLNAVRQWAQVAMRTIPIGQYAALDVTGRLIDDAVRLAAEVVDNPAPLASVTPGWDVAVAGHGELNARYFRS
jgi:urease accessory protein